MIKKINKKIICLLTVIIMLLLSSCSSYKAIMLFQNVTKNGYDISFNSLEGRIEKKMYKANSDTDISFCANLYEGEINVYYKTPLNDERVFMFNIKAGEEVKGSTGYVTSGHKATIIIETVSEAKGKFSFYYTNK